MVWIDLHFSFPSFPCATGQQGHQESHVAQLLFGALFDRADILRMLSQAPAQPQSVCWLRWDRTGRCQDPPASVPCGCGHLPCASTKESFLWSTQIVLSSWMVKGLVGTPDVFYLRFPVMSGRRGVMGEGEMQWVASSLGAPSCGSSCSNLTKRRQILVLSPTCGPEHMLPAASPCCYFETGSCFVAPADLDCMAILLSQLS